MEDNFFDELGKWLATQSVGTFGMDNGTGWGIYVLMSPPDIGKSIVLIPTPSASDPEIPTTRRNFQVLVLSSDPQESLDKARTIYNLLHRAWGVALTTIYCYNFTSTGMPFYLGMDEQERAEIVANYTAFLKGQKV